MEVCVSERAPPTLPNNGGDDPGEALGREMTGKIGKITGGDFKAKNSGHKASSPQPQVEEEEEEEEEEEMGKEDNEEEGEGEDEKNIHEVKKMKNIISDNNDRTPNHSPPHSPVTSHSPSVHPQPSALPQNHSSTSMGSDTDKPHVDQEGQAVINTPNGDVNGHHTSDSERHHTSDSERGDKNVHGDECVSEDNMVYEPKNSVEGDHGDTVYNSYQSNTERHNGEHYPVNNSSDSARPVMQNHHRLDYDEDTTDGSIKREPHLESLDDSEMAEDESSIIESYDGDDCYPLEDSLNDSFDSHPPGGVGILQRRGRGRPRGSKNRTDGRGRRGAKFRRISEDRTCTAYDLRHISDPYINQRRGRPKSRFIVDLGEQNHEAWCKNKEELNISDAELTTLLLSLLESRRDVSNPQDSDTMLSLISNEYSKWKDKFASQVSMLSHYSSIHNTNCCTCLGIKKKKYIPAGTGKRGRPRKYPPPVGYGPGMQRPDTIDEDGNIFEPQIILKDGMTVKNEPTEESKANVHVPDAGNEGCAPPIPSQHATSPNGGTTPTTGGMPPSSQPQFLGVGMQDIPRAMLTKEEIEKRREYYNNHKNKVKYVCHYCQVHFYHKPNFDYHISRLEASGKCRIFEKINNLYLCDVCGEGFSWREKLEKHLRLADQHGTHNQKELLMYGDFQCNMCGKTFNKRVTYLQHIKWHEDREDIPCVICGTMFKQVDLRHHLMEVHSNDSLPCCYCGKLFTSRKYLEKHELIHQGGNFPCPECGKAFSQKSNMQQHLKTHTLDKDYSCDHCGQTFNQRAGLCQHLRKHFGPAEFSYECDVCGQYFSSDYNLKLHRRKIHNLHVDGLPPDDLSDHSDYMGSPVHHPHIPIQDNPMRDKLYAPSNTAVKNMLGGVAIGPALGLSAMKQEGGIGPEPMDDGQLHMRDAVSHMADMRHLADRRDTPGLMKDGLEEAEDQMRMSHHHSMAVNEDALHMPQDLTRMTASQGHVSDDSGRMSAAPQPQHMSDMRNSIPDSPGRMSDTPHMTDNLGRMAAENFGRVTSTPGGYLAEHLRRMAENQSRMSDTMSHYDERDNYSRLGDNLRSMSRGSAGEPMGRLGDNLGRMTADNLSHMGVIRPTQTPSSTPQWPPHMQNHASAAAALDGMNQSPQPSQHTLYPLPFWPYDPALRQYHH